MGDQRLFPGLNGPSDARFQEILLEFSTAASQGIPALALIETFCRTARQYFRVDGVYFWQRSSSDELLGVVANGLRASEFPGMRLKDSDSAVTAEAVRTRKTVYINRVDVSRHTTAAEFHAKALMAAPLVVAGEVIGAAVFLHGLESDFFNDIWQQRQPSFVVNWEAFWKRTGSARWRSRAIEEPRFWRKWLRLCMRFLKLPRRCRCSRNACG